MNTLQNRIRGSLIGGAVGDALGYPVEFVYSFKEIQDRYGERGITRMDTKQHWLGEDEQVGKAVVSDDTQMTLFTANGVLNAKRSGMPGTIGITNAYVEWYLTQIGKDSIRFHDCWIAWLPELNRRRAPGATCMSALEAIFCGKEPHNNSKGCGGVMRVAPIPLYAASPRISKMDTGGQECRINILDASMLAGDAAQITHKHPLGFIPAALETYIIYCLVLDDKPTIEALHEYIREGIRAMYKIYPQYTLEIDELHEIIKLAISLVTDGLNDVDNIGKIGDGWVGDEALAIALYCALKHFDNFEGAMIAAVNHGGDSDSTGAITGNILGAAVGIEGIPQFFTKELEMYDLIIQIADDLYHGETRPPFASRDSWKINDAPQQYVSIPMNLEIPLSEMENVWKGHIPKCMEEHWFMYCDKKSIRYYRSWTGDCIFIASYRIYGNYCRIMELAINRYFNNGNTNSNENKDLFLTLLKHDSEVGEYSIYYPKQHL
ncbi:MAG: ADP-ribosylglycohydrolase family protein [Prevotella sp.]|nr:ADP-ribosylglycohydrolase family protein [Prevotella sp.]